MKKGMQKSKRQPEPTYERCEAPWRYKSTYDLDACMREYPDRTPYFYRQQAISWRRNIKVFWCSKDMPGTALYFAKMYLQGYRDRLKMWLDITAGKCRFDGLVGVIPLRKGVAA